MSIFGIHICGEEIAMVVPVLGGVFATWRSLRFRVRLWWASRNR